MADMFSSFSSLFSLTVGVVLLVEATVFAVRRRRPGHPKRGPGDTQWPVLLSLGVMLVIGSLARLAKWTGAPMTATLVVGVACIVAALVFTIRSRDARRRAAAEGRQDTH
jgi:drug/metabolite transporter (DMT)-like permease